MFQMIVTKSWRILLLSVLCCDYQISTVGDFGVKVGMFVRELGLE